MPPSPLPPEIRVETLSDGVRYRLPVRPLNSLTAIHVILGAVGAGLILFPFLPTLLMAGRSNPEFRTGSFWFFLVCPGGLTIPLGLFLVVYSFLLLFGRVDLRLTTTHLVGTLRFGWLMGWTRLRLADVLGFRVETHLEGQPNLDGSPRPLAGPAVVANLKAEHARERTSWVVYAYPAAVLEPLAAELTARLEARGQTVALETRRLDPTEVRDRPEQPVGSTALLAADGDGHVIDLPAKGLWGGNQGGLLFFGGFWNLIVWPISLVMLYQTATGGLEWDKGEKTSLLLALAFLTPFWAVGVGVLLAIWHNAVKRTRIRIHPDRLTVESVGVFGTTEQGWGRGEIRAVRALTVASKSDGATEYATGLLVQAGSDEEHFLFADRPREEVEWIATTARGVMAVPATDPAEQPEPDDDPATPEPPAPSGWAARRLALQGALCLVLFLVGWEWRSGHDGAGRASTVYFGPVFFFAAAPQAKDLPEAKAYPGVSVSRWYLGGAYRSSSSVGKVK